MEKAEHLCHNDAGNDQQVANDNGGTRSAEEVAQEESQHYLGVAPQQEHHHNDQRVGLGRRYTKISTCYHLTHKYLRPHPSSRTTVHHSCNVPRLHFYLMPFSQNTSTASDRSSSPCVEPHAEGQRGDGHYHYDNTLPLPQTIPISLQTIPRTSSPDLTCVKPHAEGQGGGSHNHYDNTLPPPQTIPPPPRTIPALPQTLPV